MSKENFHYLKINPFSDETVVPVYMDPHKADRAGLIPDGSTSAPFKTFNDAMTYLQSIRFGTSPTMNIYLTCEENEYFEFNESQRIVHPDIAELHINIINANPIDSETNTQLPINLRFKVPDSGSVYSEPRMFMIYTKTLFTGSFHFFTDKCGTNTVRPMCIAVYNGKQITTLSRGYTVLCEFTFHGFNDAIYLNDNCSLGCTPPIAKYHFDPSVKVLVNETTKKITGTDTFPMTTITKYSGTENAYDINYVDATYQIYARNALVQIEVGEFKFEHCLYGFFMQFASNLRITKGQLVQVTTINKPISSFVFIANHVISPINISGMGSGYIDLVSKTADEESLRNLNGSTKITFEETFISTNMTLADSWKTANIDCRFNQYKDNYIDFVTESDVPPAYVVTSDTTAISGKKYYKRTVGGVETHDKLTYAANDGTFTEVASPNLLGNTYYEKITNGSVYSTAFIMSYVSVSFSGNTNINGDIVEAGNITKISIAQKTSGAANYPDATEYSVHGWYRRWSDGTIEQVFDLPTDITYSASGVNTLNKVILPMKFSSNNYKVFLQSTSSSSFDKDSTSIYEVNKEYFVFDSTRYSNAFGFHVFCIGK